MIIAGGEFMAQQKCIQVACNVSNCHYYGEGDICVANKIQVSNIEFGTNMKDMEAGKLGKSAPADNSHTTQCVTFKPKQ